MIKNKIRRHHHQNQQCQRQKRQGSSSSSSIHNHHINNNSNLLHDDNSSSISSQQAMSPSPSPSPPQTVLRRSANFSIMSQQPGAYRISSPSSSGDGDVGAAVIMPLHLSSISTLFDDDDHDEDNDIDSLVINAEVVETRHYQQQQKYRPQHNRRRLRYDLRSTIPTRHSSEQQQQQQQQQSFSNGGNGGSGSGSGIGMVVVNDASLVNDYAELLSSELERTEQDLLRNDNNVYTDTNSYDEVDDQYYDNPTTIPIVAEEDPYHKKIRRRLLRKHRMIASGTAGAVVGGSIAGIAALNPVTFVVMGAVGGAVAARQISKYREQKKDKRQSQQKQNSYICHNPIPIS